MLNLKTLKKKCIFQLLKSMKDPKIKESFTTKIQQDLAFLLSKKENFKYCKIKNLRKDWKSVMDLDKLPYCIIQRENKQFGQNKIANCG